MANEISDLALVWLARRQRTDDDPALEAELEAWLAADSRHQGAFLRAEAAWHMLDQAAAIRHEGPFDGQEGTGEQGNVMPRRRVLIGGGMAAAMIATIGAAFLKPWSGSEAVETGFGEIRTVPLSDGSRATLDSASRLTVAMNGEVRTVSLERGDAWFEVKKDHTRPFVVEAGEARIRAVGTAFAVRRVNDGALIDVTEGIVDIWSSTHSGERLRAEAGARVALNSGEDPKLIETSLEAVERSLAWRQGQLFFAGDTLESAVDQFNRYNIVPIVIADERLRARKMVGRFGAKDPVDFARAAARMFGSHVEVTPEHIVIGSAPG